MTETVLPPDITFTPYTLRFLDMTLLTGSLEDVGTYTLRPCVGSCRISCLACSGTRVQLRDGSVATISWPSDLVFVVSRSVPVIPALAVPEPSTLPLLGAGLLVLALAARTRRRAARILAGAVLATASGVSLADVLTINLFARWPTPDPWGPSALSLQVTGDAADISNVPTGIGFGATFLSPEVRGAIEFPRERDVETRADSFGPTTERIVSASRISVSAQGGTSAGEANLSGTISFLNFVGRLVTATFDSRETIRFLGPGPYDAASPYIPVLSPSGYPGVVHFCYPGLVTCTAFSEQASMIWNYARTTTLVPEPSAVMLLALAGLVFAGALGRRRSAPRDRGVSFTATGCRP